VAPQNESTTCFFMSQSAEPVAPHDMKSTLMTFTVLLAAASASADEAPRSRAAVAIAAGPGRVDAVYATTTDGAYLCITPASLADSVENGAVGACGNDAVLVPVPPPPEEPGTCTVALQTPEDEWVSLEWVTADGDLSELEAIAGVLGFSSLTEFADYLGVAAGSDREELASTL
jgi:hypothetical protein